MLLRVRLKNLFLYLPCIVAFVVIFPVVVINSYHLSIYILEQDEFFLFLDGDVILDPIEEPLVVIIAQHTISPI